jgi:hypothetical protein
MSIRLHSTGGDCCFLFDVVNDPTQQQTQQTNLIDDANYASVVSTANSKLMQYIAQAVN